MDKIKYLPWIFLALFILFAKSYTHKIEYPENIMYFYEELPVGKQEIVIFSDDQPMGYHEITIFYETFPTIYKNDFNMDYEFIDANNDIPNEIKYIWRVFRAITTLS